MRRYNGGAEDKTMTKRIFTTSNAGSRGSHPNLARSIIHLIASRPRIDPHLLQDDPKQPRPDITKTWEFPHWALRLQLGEILARIIIHFDKPLSRPADVGKLLRRPAH
jgi:hypothetical protein